MGGSIQKLTIDTYKDSNYDSGKINSNTFTALINPTGFSLTRKNEYNQDTAQGTSEADGKFNKALPSELRLEFLFDGTGVTEANGGNVLVNKIKQGLGKNNPFSAKAVTTQLFDFYKATGSYDGSIHKPYNVIITWGKFQFHGVLTEFTIDYKMFNNDGTPLRAIGKATFSGSIGKELEALLSVKQSPDLTHKRTVKAGDTLPLMTKSIYGDSKYYLEVAKANSLINFRKLTPGQELYFPPIEKIS